MACSTARVEANRRNAQQSTGPRTAAGKAASRLNAFRHGLAGDGAVVGPDEDVALIEGRAAAFVREFAAEGETGRLLARRAAVLSVRMERATVQDFAKVGADVAAAREQFDADRQALIADWIAGLDEADDPRPALDDLEQTVEGQAHLADAWLDLRARVAAGDAGAVEQAETWLDRPGLTGPAVPAALLDRIGAEADAEHGMNRAFHALREHASAAEPPGRGPIVLPPLIPAPTPAPPPAPVDEPAPDSGSFRAEPAELGSSRLDLLAPPAEPALSRKERRRNRPDLRKLARNRR